MISLVEEVSPMEILFYYNRSFISIKPKQKMMTANSTVTNINLIRKNL